LKLLLYSHSWAPAVGGVETVTRALAEGVAELREGRPDDQIDLTLVTRTRMGAMDDSSLPFRVIRRPGFWELVGLIRAADVIHLAGPAFVPLALGYMFGKVVVVEHHGYQAMCPNGLLFLMPEKAACPGYFAMKRYTRCLRCRAAEVGAIRGLSSVLLTFPRRWLCERAAANIAITNHVGKRLGLPRSQLIYHGVQDGGGGEAIDGGVLAGPLVVAYVGRLVGEKGLPLLLQAASRLKSDGVCVRLKFVGDGPERKSLEELTDRLELRDWVRFTGYLSGDKLENEMREVSAVIMPSIWEETAGLAAIEQMMRGRLVIAADIGGLAEVVDNAGLKFTPGDWQGLAACIRKVIDDPSIVRSIGSTARDRAARLFRRDDMVEAHLTLYREAVPFDKHS
jgi:glycosyltransferase involved in cell wall biosynthesis